MKEKKIDINSSLKYSFILVRHIYVYFFQTLRLQMPEFIAVSFSNILSASSSFLVALQFSWNHPVYWTGKSEGHTLLQIQHEL